MKTGAVTNCIVAVIAVGSKDQQQRRDAQKALRILVSPERDEKPSRRGRKRTKDVQRRTPDET